MEDEIDQSRTRVSRRSLLTSAGAVGGLAIGLPIVARSQDEQEEDILGIFAEYEVQFIGSQNDTTMTTTVGGATTTGEMTTTAEAVNPSLFYDGGINLSLFQGLALPVSSVEPLEECDWMVVEMNTFSDADDFLRLIGLIEPTEIELDRVRILDKRGERVLRCQEETDQ